MPVRWFQIGLICGFFAAGVSSGLDTVRLRINNVRESGGRLSWDIEIRSGEQGTSRIMGSADFYFQIHAAAFAGDEPVVSGMNAALVDNPRYVLRAGRSLNGSKCWIAVDDLEPGPGAPFSATGDWESLFSCSLRLMNPSLAHDVAWDTAATGMLGPLLPLDIIYEPNGSLSNDLSLTFEDISEFSTAGMAKGTHAVCFTDVTEDFLPDLYSTRYRTDNISDQFFRNDDGTVFYEEGKIRGIDDLDGGSHGALFADLDNDGDFDLVNGTTVKRPGTSGDHNNFFENTGRGFFTDRTADIPAVARSNKPTRAVVALDMEGDGDLDVFTVSGFSGSGDPVSEANEVFVNQGGWIFSDEPGGRLSSVAAGQGAVAVDYDNDGDVDILACNRTGDFHVMQNDGAGHFTRIEPASIGITHRAGDGISAGDVDNDGDSDLLLVSEWYREAFLYENLGSGTFSLLDILPHSLGFMGGFADLDNDGDLDLVFADRGRCLLNDGTGLFGAGPELPMPALVDPRSVAFADFDLDGDLDLAISDKETHTWMIRNNLEPIKSWLKVQLFTPNGQAGAFGARVRLFPAGQQGEGLIGYKQAQGAYGYMAQDDPVLHFGLGDRNQADVEVEFLTGETIVYRSVDAGRILTIRKKDIKLDLRVFLQGPFREGGTMAAALNQADLLPVRSPYPQDTSLAAVIPEDAVDWILIELYSPDQSMKVYRAGLLLSDGTVADCMTGYAPLTVRLYPGRFFIRLHHRNHLPVASRAAMEFADSVSHDFTSSSDQYYHQTGCLELKSGVWGMIAGHTEQEDLNIFAGDLALICRAIDTSADGYFPEDINLDGQVSDNDYEMARRNMLLGAFSESAWP
ncbi:CRTAC1 family protein [bacterium]|nr:CRTAC1 family protein [bacterium]